MAGNVSDTATTIRTGVVGLEADLAVPRDATGVVVFAHGSGSSRLSPRNRMVASRLQQAGLGTLLFDLLTPAEDAVYSNRFDIPLLASRLLTATSWLREQPGLENVGVGYFGASTGAAAALVAAAELDGTISAVVSRGGRPDLAGDSLPRVTAPVLLIVGGDDPVVIEMNRDAFARLGVEKRLDIVPGATHLFEEPGTLEQVAELATGWFAEHLG
jgi:putative phosphoribosyl transferase